MKQAIKNNCFRFGRIILFTICALISAYILMSGYESIYVRPLPFVHTIATVNLDAFSRSYALNASSGQKSSLDGYFGKPLTLKLPARSLRLDIVPAFRENGSGPWLARSDTVQLLIPSRPRQGDIGIALLYCRSGFQTLATQVLPTPGQNIFMDTDQGWRYVYRVTASQVIPQEQPYVVSDDGSTGKLVIVANDSAHKTDGVVEATLLSVQGVNQ